LRRPTEGLSFFIYLIIGLEREKMQKEFDIDEWVAGPADGVPTGPDEDFRKPENYREKYRRRRNFN